MGYFCLFPQDRLGQVILSTWQSRKVRHRRKSTFLSFLIHWMGRCFSFVCLLLQFRLGQVILSEYLVAPQSQAQEKIYLSLIFNSLSATRGWEIIARQALCGKAPQMLLKFTKLQKNIEKKICTKLFEILKKCESFLINVFQKSISLLIRNFKAY